MSKNRKNKAVKTDGILLENLDLTLKSVIEDALPYFGILDYDIRLIGSLYKKPENIKYNDIDIAVKVKEVNKEIFERLSRSARNISHDVKCSFNIGVISFSWPISGPSQQNEYIQIDLMPTTNLDFFEFSYFSPSYEQSKYKGVYRNLMLIAIAKYCNYFEVVTENNKVIAIDRYMYKINEGLFRIYRSLNTKYKELNSKTFITNNPQEILQLIFNLDYKCDWKNEFISFEQIYEYITSDKFKNKKMLSYILDDVKNGLLRMKYDLPKELL